MSQPEQPHSVGIVTPQVARFSEPLSLTCGRELPSYELVYETYGELNDAALQRGADLSRPQRQSSRRGLPQPG